MESTPVFERRMHVSRLEEIGYRSIFVGRNDVLI